MPNIRLVSPDDRSPLHEANGSLIDRSGNTYPIVNGVPHLYPKNRISGVMKYTLADHQSIRSYNFRRTLVPLFPEHKVKAESVKEVNIVGFIPPPHAGAVCLDHGCGGGNFRGFIESCGYTYVGADNESGVSTEQGGGEHFHGGATHLCDLHRLPFDDNAFQFAVSYSVFEHLQNPVLGAAELFRVMEPDGIAFVAVGSIVPFHMDSFYHQTHYGVLATFRNAGFEVSQVAAANWNAYRAIAAMDGLPGPKWIRQALIEPVYGAHRLLWAVRSRLKRKNREAEELRRHMAMAGIVKAVLIKPL